MKQVNEKKIDNRKKYFMVLDVETAGNIGSPLVYDLGFAICDKKGNIYERRSFVIKEIFEQTHLMQTAYYACKLPLYFEGLKTGAFTMVTFLEARHEFLQLMAKYNVKTICAYNLMFDMRALKSTTEKLYGKGKKFLSKEYKDVDLLCIWSFACEVLYTQKSFSKTAVEQGWLTEKGNMQTSAEIGWRYITKDFDFVEHHTGLEDVEIECQILARCIAQHKKHEAGIIAHPWRIPNQK